MDAVKKQQFTPEELENVLNKLDIKPNKQVKEAMLYGEYSDIQHIKLKNQDNTLLKEGRIRLHKNDKNEIDIQYQFRNKELEIPKRILNHDLQPDELKRLTKGEFVKIPKKDLFIQVDPSLNAVAVKTSQELKVPSKIMGYELTDKDKEGLLNKGSMETKVFKGDLGYYTANIGFDPQKGELKAMNVLKVPDNKVEEYLKKYNTPQQTQNITSDMAKGLSNSIDKTQQIEPSKTTQDIANSLAQTVDKGPSQQKTNAKSNEVPPLGDSSFVKEFKGAIESNDVNKLNALAKSGKSISDEQLKMLDNSNLSKEAKVGFAQAFNRTYTELDSYKNIEKTVKENTKSEKLDLKQDQSQEKEPKIKQHTKSISPQRAM